MTSSEIDTAAGDTRPNVRLSSADASFARPRAYVLIPVHNRREFTLRCLEHLRTTGAFAVCRCVVIDDGSTDGTARAVTDRFAADVDLLVGSGDLWWTGAMELGMRHAIDQGGRFLIWLNDDCLPSEGALATMIAYMESHPDTLVGPACYPEGQPEEWQATGFRGRHNIAPQRGEAVAVEGFSGFCVGMPAEVCGRIGYPDVKRFPHYCGDGMYTLAAVRAGFQARILGTCTAVLADYKAPSSGFADFVRYQAGFRQAFAAAFLQIKSRYYLRSSYYYYQAKYGRLQGSLLFLGRTLSWIFDFCATWLRLFTLGWKQPLTSEGAGAKTPKGT